MIPKKTTIEGERDERIKDVCDTIMHRAATMMVEEIGAPIPMMLDRVLTFAAAQACAVDGSPRTAAAFREFADRIEQGLFHPVTGEDLSGGERH